MKGLKKTKKEKNKISRLIELDKEARKLPELSASEEAVLEHDHLFDATFYSNKLEGNTLNKNEARRAIMSED